MLQSETFVFVDGHVHIYGCYEAGQVFDGAWSNISTAAARLGVARNFQAVLILTESAGDKAFDSLSEGSAVAGWQISRTGEPGALSLQRDDDARLLLLAGRQLVSAEKLEISAYFVTKELADGAPLDNVLQQVARAGGLAILPWGVGKWLGKRGQDVKRVLSQHQLPLLVSDNGGRPWFWPTPRLFRTAERLGVPVLAGTDSLPKASEQQKAGGYGFVMKGALSQESPGQDMKNRLLALERSPMQYGRREGIWPFFRNQISMQARRAR